MKIDKGKIAIYVHRKLDTMEPFYIGLGVNNRPWSFNKRSDEWKNIYNKQGVFVEILETVEDRKLAELIEESYIYRFGRIGIDKNGILVNKSRGGEGASLQKSEIWRKRISESKMGNKFSEEHRKNLSKAKTGTKLSEETKIKIRDYNLGRKMPDWYSEYVRNRQYGSNNSSSVQVIDKNTNMIYGCIKECAIENNINPIKLYKMLSGQNKNTTSLSYYRA